MVLVEPKQRVGGASLFIFLLEVDVLLRIRSMIWLQNKSYISITTKMVKVVSFKLHAEATYNCKLAVIFALTFLRGLPLPRPLVGGALVSPSGPLECFYLMWV